MEKLPLPFDMRENRFTDLNAAKLLFADFPDDITGINLDAVQELHRVVTAVDKFDNEAVFVLIQIAGIIVKIRCRPLPSFCGALLRPCNQIAALPSGLLWKG